MAADQMRWARLHELALQVKALAPWRFMAETDVFAVETTERGPVLVSVMGAAGTHFAVAAYPGALSIYGFLALLDADENDPGVPVQLLEIDHLQLSFEDRVDTKPRDRKLLADLGIRPRGAHAWPRFRRYRAGFVPWFIADSDADLMIVVLEQLLHVAPRFAADNALLEAPAGQHCMMRSPDPEQAGRWQEKFVCIAPPPPVVLDARVPSDVVAILAARPKSAFTVEVDVFPEPSMVIDGKADGIGQPYYPYLLMAVEARRGVIIGCELLNAIPDLSALWSSVPFAVVRLLDSLPDLPQELRVSSARLESLLRQLAVDIGIGLRRVSRLASLERAQRSFKQFTGRR